MNSTVFRYFLFPHLTSNERDYRHLSILVPSLTVLQVLRPPVLPEWGADQFSSWPSITEHEHAEQIKLYLKGYQDFADLHGEDSVLASMSHSSIEKDARESRFMIQGELRGKNAPAPELKERLLIEAAVFMEMARDLDEKQMELEASFRRVESLEEDFREILGITDDEDFEEAAETLSPPLAPDPAHLSFMLRRRIACWFRMYHNRPSEEVPVLVARSNEVIEELLDPLRSECERTGEILPMERIPLVSIPSLENLDLKAFESIRRELHSSRVMAEYWSSLQDFLREPHNTSSLETLEVKAAELEKQVESLCRDMGTGSRTPIRLTLVLNESRTCADFWRCIDRTGHNEWQETALIAPSRPVLLSLT